MILTVSAMLSPCDTYLFCHFYFSILIDSDEEPLVPIEAEDSESDVCSYLFAVTKTPGRPYDNNNSFIVAVACSYWGALATTTATAARTSLFKRLRFFRTRSRLLRLA